MSKSKKIDWLNHLLGFTVVMIGILIAFQLNTFSENRKESKLVQEHINAIVSETEFNNKRMDYAINATQVLLTKLDSLMERVNASENLDKANLLALQMLQLEPNYIKKNAYNSLIQTGDIRFIDDFNLKNDIVNLYEYYTWTDGVDEMTRQSFLDLYYPYVVDNLDLMGGKTQDAEIYTNKRFKNILSVYKFTLKARLRKFEETQTIIKNFLEGRKEIFKEMKN